MSRSIEKREAERGQTEIWLQFSPEVKRTVTTLVAFPVLSYVSLTFANLGFLMGINFPKILASRFSILLDTELVVVQGLGQSETSTPELLDIHR